MSLFLNLLLATILLPIIPPGRAHAKVVTNTVSVAFENEAGLSFTRTSSASFNSTASPVLTLIKSASATDLYPGRETILTIAVANTGGSTAYALAVADTIPALLEYVPGTASPAAGAVFGPSPGTGGRLFWLVSSLPPGGGLVITFRARALEPGGSVQAVTNTAGVTVSLPVPAGATGSVVVTVRPHAPPSPPAALSALISGSSVVLTWQASAPGSTPVSAYRIYRGTYPGWVPSAANLVGTVGGPSALSFTDPAPSAGADTRYVVRAFDEGGRESGNSNEAKPAQPGTIRLIVEVFDVTGRLVRTLADGMGYAAAGVASVGNGSGAVRIDTASPVVILLTDGTRLTWNGLDSTGMRLPNGIYVVRATAVYPDGRRAVASSTFTIARAYEHLVESALLVPNPASEAAWIALRLSSALSTVEVRIYNVAGELVFKGSIPGTARSWRWDLRNSRGQKVASGLYVIALDVRDGMTGARETVLRKLAVSDR